MRIFFKYTDRFDVFQIHQTDKTYFILIGQSSNATGRRSLLANQSMCTMKFDLHLLSTQKGPVLQKDAIE